MNESVGLAIAEMGAALGPDIVARCRTLFAAEQEQLAAALPPVADDLAYGPSDRQQLDLYARPGPGAKPVLLFVHGGGFVLGDKRDGGSWGNANVGRMAAEAGFLGAVMNYRLAPDSGWPAGSEDVAAAVDWLRRHAARYGGDAARIILCGTSAGAVHIAGYLQLRPDSQDLIRGAVLLSGLYGYTALDVKDERYYGDPALYRERMPRKAVVATVVPLFVACAEYDPPRFQAEFLGLMQERLDRQGAMPRGSIAAGHNHYSMAMHLGTSDRRLAAEIIEFARNCCR